MKLAPEVPFSFDQSSLRNNDNFSHFTSDFEWFIQGNRFNVKSKY
jgi:hypothetical protein